MFTYYIDKVLGSCVQGVCYHARLLIKELRLCLVLYTLNWVRANVEDGDSVCVKKPL